MHALAPRCLATSTSWQGCICVYSYRCRDVHVYFSGSFGSWSWCLRYGDQSTQSFDGPSRYKFYFFTNMINIEINILNVGMLSWIESMAQTNCHFTLIAVFMTPEGAVTQPWVGIFIIPKYKANLTPIKVFLQGKWFQDLGVASSDKSTISSYNNVSSN